MAIAVYSDESKIHFDFKNGHVRVWGWEADCFLDAAFPEHDRPNGGSLMEWDGSSMCHVIPCTVSKATILVLLSDMTS